MRGRQLYLATYNAALALRDLGALGRFGPADLVAFRVPDEPHPIVLALDRSESEPGLALLRGPGALELAFALGALGSVEAVAESAGGLDLLACRFARLEQVEPGWRRALLTRARLRPPPGALVPCVTVARPGEAPRQPDDRETALLLLVLRGLLAALADGLVAPGELGRAEGLPTLVVRPVQGEAEVEVVGLEVEPSEPPPALAVDREALEGLPRLARGWVVGCELPPFALEGEDGVARLLVVLEKGTGRLLDGLPVAGPRWPYLAASRVVELAATGGLRSPPGLPRSVLSTSRAVSALLCPELRVLGVPCRFDRGPEGRVADAVQALAERLRRGS